MRIAFVTPYLPHPLDAGGKIRSFHLLRGLALAHEVDLYTVHYGQAPQAPPALAGLCASIRSIPLEARDGLWRKAAGAFRPFTRALDHFGTPASRAEARQRLAAGGYDLLVADELCMTPYVVGLSQRKLAARQKIEHRHHAALSERLAPAWRRRAQQPDLCRLRRFERDAMSAMDAAVCCSDEDADQLRALSPDVPVAVIGNGVDPEYFHPLPERGGPPTLVYLGTLDYPPNLDALRFFFEAIHPRLASAAPGLRVLVVGRNPAPAALAWSRLPGVSVAGSVPDVRPYLAEATAAIVPLRVGGGTRIKILECLAAGRAVVSTSIGAEGLGLRAGEHLLLADDPQAFARETLRLLGDRELRQRLARAGRVEVAARCSWTSLGRRFAELCAAVAARGTP